VFVRSTGQVFAFFHWGGSVFERIALADRVEGGRHALWWVRGRLVRPELAFLQSLRVLGRSKASLHSVSRSTLRSLLRSNNNRHDAKSRVFSRTRFQLRLQERSCKYPARTGLAAHRDGAASLNNSDSEISFSEGPFARLSYIGSRIVDSR